MTDDKWHERQQQLHNMRSYQTQPKRTRKRMTFTASQMAVAIASAERTEKRN